MDINLTLIGQSVAMIFFVWFCMKFVWPLMLAPMEARQKEIADGLAAGEKASADLEQAKIEADKLVAEARSQAMEIVEQANKRAGSIVSEGKDEGVRERERQLLAARSEIEQETNRAKDELRNQVSTLAVASAEKILDREIDESAHQDLLAKLAAQI